MFVEIYVNNEHLHTYAAYLFNIHDTTNYLQFESLQEKYEHRRCIINYFLLLINQQLQKNKIQHAQIFLLVKSCPKRRPKKRPSMLKA